MPGKKIPRTSDSYSSKTDYVKRLEAAGDTRTPKVKKQEQDIDQVFEPQQEQGPDDGGSNFLRDFWDSLTN